ncbi:hypothetical protein M231_07784 [Tremella mesenterica]|uniref:BRCT domain-containing protein n=1 Tax=Tremella mesenterica TaxID=5217 RepID=A0A4V1M2Y3_TREME|nr:hypothetical protein M231_07784 [Tremella mesenterica]
MSATSSTHLHSLPSSRRASASFVPLQTRTRAMSRLSTIPSRSSPLSRPPLRPSEPNSDNRKRRISLDVDQERPTKTSKGSEGEKILPDTPRRHPFDEVGKEENEVKPTPARILLKHGYRVTRVESDSSDDDSTEGVIIRPPTPPRLNEHVPTSLTSRITMSQDQLGRITSQKRAMSPDENVQPPRTIRRLDVSMSTPRESTFIPPSKNEINVTRPVIQPVSGNTPNGPTTPKRVLAGISRLGLTPSPVTLAIQTGNDSKEKTETTVATTNKMEQDIETSTRPKILKDLSKRKDRSFIPTISRIGAKTSIPHPSSIAERPSTTSVMDEDKGKSDLIRTTTSGAVTFKSQATGPTSMLPPKSTFTFKKPSTQPTQIQIPTSTVGQPLPKKSLPTSGLPVRRPSSRPALIDPEKENTLAPLPDPPIRRKPSYPSSLGSGPMARPTPRVVSNPVPHHRSVTYPVPSNKDVEVSAIPSITMKSPHRSVSAPVPREKLGLNMSQRRESDYADASKSLNGLNDALSRLRMQLNESTSESRRSRHSLQVPELPPVAHIAERSERTATQGHASVRVTAVHRPRHSVAGPIHNTGTEVGDTSTSSEEGAADKSLAGLLCSTIGGGCLKGVKAFVDVHTDDGADSSAVFVDMLKGLGAKVLARLTDSCTHIIYKSGKGSTLSWYRRQEDKPFIVSVRWVMKCKEAGERLGEEGFGIKLEDEDVFAKNRKSMEPKQLLAMSTTFHPIPIIHEPPKLLQIRQRTLLYAPKISSPLKSVHRRDSMDLSE